MAAISPGQRMSKLEEGGIPRVLADAPMETGLKGSPCGEIPEATRESDRVRAQYAEAVRDRLRKEPGGTTSLRVHARCVISSFEERGASAPLVR